MADATAPAAPAAKAKKPATKPTHPSSIVMVTAAITALKERSGSSLQAIKKYIAANYKCDVDKLNKTINTQIKKAVEKGVLVQVKGSYKVAKVEKKKVDKASKPAK